MPDPHPPEQGQSLEDAARSALARLEQDERDSGAWRALGEARESAGDWDAALRCYEAALMLDGAAADWAIGAGQRAEAAGRTIGAERLLTLYLAFGPPTEAAAHALANLLRGQERTDDAISVLLREVAARPQAANLRSQLSVFLAQQGQMDEALAWIEEALRIAPAWPVGLANRANVRIALGDAEGCLADLDAALAAAPASPERASMGVARASALLSMGRLPEGWAAYAARRDLAYGGHVRFDIDRPAWTAERPLEGLRLLAVAEQGLGDEVMFMNLVPDLIRSLGPSGRLTLAADWRLGGLLARSFPQVEVLSHLTLTDPLRRSAPDADLGRIDAWAPLGDLLAVLRPGVNAFPVEPGFLIPDPERVAAIEQALTDLPPGPRIGLAWKSAGPLRARSRYYPPLEAWKPLFDLPDAQIVSLQYGDTDAEAAFVQEAWGKILWRFPGLDMKDDLEGVAALGVALDAAAGPMNASMALAGAVGAKAAMLMVSESWTRLGTDRLPWYPQAFAASAPGPNDWAPAIGSAIRRIKAWIA